MKTTGDINFTNNSVMSLPIVTWNVAPNLDQKGAEWYVGLENRTVAYAYTMLHSCVVRVAGNLRIEILGKYRSQNELVNETELWQWGITTDAQLDELVLEKKKFKYLENPYFEIVDPMNQNFVMGASHNIFTAVQTAITLLCEAR